MAKYHESKRRDKGPHSKMEQLDSREFYAGAANRNRQEFEDGGMIHEDNRAIANLPQEVMMKDYPKIDMYMPGDLNDGISGIDREGYANSHIARRQLKPRKA